MEAGPVIAQARPAVATPRPGRCRRGLLHLGAALVLLAGLMPYAGARAGTPPISAVTLTPSLPSGQPVGTAVSWTASASGGASLVYQFSVASGGDMAIVRDYAAWPTFLWMPMQEGLYWITVSVKSGFGATSVVSATVPYVVASRVSGTTPVVSATVHPLVALYSAPSCAAHWQLKVVFRPVSSAFWQSTASQACQPGLSTNVLIAGMRPHTQYLMRHIIYSGSSYTWSPITLTYTTGMLPPSLSFPTETISPTVIPPGSFGAPVVLQSLLPTTTATPPSIATDLYGRVLWYYAPSLSPELNYPDPPRVLRIVSGGTFLVIGGDGWQNASVVAEINLAGVPIRETTVGRVNEQLTAMGQPTISGFHHDAIRLPNGDTAVLGYLTQSVAGTSVLGDMVIVLDSDFQVVWAWNAFAHMSPLRYPAVLGETCAMNYSILCPSPNPQAQDWLHSNAISYSPADGNLTVSMRDQDAVVKLDYENGRGNGAILWRLGQGGDFTIRSSDPWPWFSHQHDVRYISPTTLILFDNGNTRCQNAPPSCDSRGQVLQLDEASKVVTPTVNVDVGSYSSALGSGEQLSNGNYFFTSGVQQPGPFAFAQAVELQPAGGAVYLEQVPLAEYRSYRLTNLYTVPDASGGTGT